MASSSAAHSVRITVAMPNRPGALGRLATAIGGVGGNITNIGINLTDIEMGEATPDTVVEEVCVDTSGDDHVAEIRAAIETLEGVRVTSCIDRTFELHEGGKISVSSKHPLTSRDDLSMAYTPGVARVCRAIEADPAVAHTHTIKANMVAVVSDGTAVLGLGDIGPAAALPVMEGKAQLFKEFAGVDAFPICLDVDDADQLVEAVERLSPVFGGINLEDIAAPRCFEVEERLVKSLDIPVFHDDQHGTAVVVLAALQNALKVVDKEMSDLKVVIAGVGAAGVAIAKILDASGVPNIIGVDRKGAIWDGRDDLNPAKQWFAEKFNPEQRQGTLGEMMNGADVFVGVSGPGLVTRDDLLKMGTDPIVFALANPDPEITPEDADGAAAVIATGRSDYPNQINNVLCFPGIFRGAMDARATRITEGMKLAAASAIAASVNDAELAPGMIVPSVFNRAVAPAVAAAVAKAAIAEGVTRD